MTAWEKDYQRALRGLRVDTNIIIHENPGCCYCKFYKHHIPSGLGWSPPDDCKHKSNIETVEKYDYTYYKEKALPKELNNNRDCSNYIYSIWANSKGLKSWLLFMAMLLTISIYILILAIGG